MWKRIILFFIFMIAIITLPWFVSALGLLACLIFIPSYFEGVVVAYFMDLMFSIGVPILFGLPFTFFALIAYIAVAEIRKRMFIY